MKPSIWEKIFSDHEPSELAPGEIQQLFMELAEAARETEAVRHTPEHQRLLEQLREAVRQLP